MPEPIAYCNGRYVPLSSLVVPIYDTGFLQGATVAEVLRTFAGRLFRLDRHLARLAHSLEIVGVRLPIEFAELAVVAERLAADNHRLLASGDDISLTIFVTPGPYPGIAPRDVKMGPTLCVYARPLAFGHWAEKYMRGESLVVSKHVQVPRESWPPELKCRSRMHYYLADREAESIEPGARAVLLDESGYVCEATTANVLACFEGQGIVSPPHEKILPGVSAAMIAELAAQLGIAHTERDLTPADMSRASEILLTSTSPCVLPVVRWNGQPVGSGGPGEIYRSLLAAWSQSVGVDIPAQASQFAARS
jgi:branched-subunit amino acid aminotransferase/4-amino-4-deoxychorismate lyase